MVRKMWEFIVVAIVLVIGLNIAYVAVQPYLPATGIALCILIILGAIVWVWRWLNRRGSPHG